MDAISGCYEEYKVLKRNKYKICVVKKSSIVVRDFLK
jgi:hypothetical protein